MTTNFDMLGRDEINDLEAILSISNSDVEEIQHTVRAHADALFTWDYERSKPALVKLYEKAKTSQWNAETDLDWSIEVDQEAVVRANQANIRSNSVELYRAFVLSLLRWGRCEPEQHAEPKFTSELGKIRAPTLVVTSDNDHLIPASRSHRRSKVAATRACQPIPKPRSAQRREQGPQNPGRRGA